MWGGTAGANSASAPAQAVSASDRSSAASSRRGSARSGVRWAGKDSRSVAISSNVRRGASPGRVDLGDRQRRRQKSMLTCTTARRHGPIVLENGPDR